MGGYWIVGMKLWIVAIVLIVLACVWLFSFVGSALAEPAAKFWCAVTLRGGNKECVENTKRKLQSALGDVRLWLGVATLGAAAAAAAKIRARFRSSPSSADDRDRAPSRPMAPKSGGRSPLFFSRIRGFR